MRGSDDRSWGGESMAISSEDCDSISTEEILTTESDWDDTDDSVIELVSSEEGIQENQANDNEPEGILVLSPAQLTSSTYQLNFKIIPTF